MHIFIKEKIGIEYCIESGIEPRIIDFESVTGEVCTAVHLGYVLRNAEDGMRDELGGKLLKLMFMAFPNPIIRAFAFVNDCSLVEEFHRREIKNSKGTEPTILNFGENHQDEYMWSSAEAHDFVPDFLIYS